METLVFEAPEDKSLFEAVMSLPAKYRTVIHLFYYEDYSVTRIAEILHSREGTIKSQLNRGRQLLILVFNKTVKNRFIRLLFQQPAA